MPDVFVSDETFSRLQARTVPLVDTADSVIRRLLDLAEAAGQASDSQLLNRQGARETRPIQLRSTAQRSTGRRPRRATTDTVLRQRGVIGPGTRIAVVLQKLPPGADRDDRKFTARFAQNARDVIWDFDGSVYSISNLAKRLGATFGVHANPDSENGFRIFGLADNRSTDLERLRFDLEEEALPASDPDREQHSDSERDHPNGWLEDIIAALASLGGSASLGEIYKEVARRRTPPLPESFEATIRGTIECHSSDSAKFAGRDVFYSVSGLGEG
ncbi:MAG TPA: hypothetical protein VFY90_00895, partial [Tepidiformaceae bacterium]|nr:hypothetical protein [Tepidiformaceae bacterium]